MLFSSVTFIWLFIPIIIILHIFTNKNIKINNMILLIASLLFYAWGEPINVILMLLSILINWIFGSIVSKKSKFSKLFLIICIAINLLILGYFKYFNFFVDTINGLFKTQVLDVKTIGLPIGISFFTFQALSYVVDVYRGDCKVQKNLLNLALYVSFFPQLIAGPIVRYVDIDEQIESRTFDVEKFAIGFRRFIYGFGKKIIISNTMAELADYVFSLEFSNLALITAWIGIIAYSLQIYFDFSGYSDMAIGLGKIFGFDFLENFNYPYLSKSIQEFWQRWHISLGTWFREYVYIPLGGNRKGKTRTYINLFSVFFLTGLWHGASWNFVFWGLYHGFFQILERLGMKKLLSKHRLLGSVYCLLVVVIGWVFFRSNTLTDSINYVSHMLLPLNHEIINNNTIYILSNSRYVFIILIAIIGCGPLQGFFSAKYTRINKFKFSYFELGYLSIVFVYCLMLLASGTYNPFIYFRF